MWVSVSDMNLSASQATNTQCGRWVRERTYAEFHDLAKGSLANWRFRDRQAGRKEAPPGYPRYKYWGTAVRYWLPPSDTL